MTEVQPHSPWRAGRIALTMGLLAISVLSAMAFASTASAAPTAFCKASENPCSSANTYPTGTTLELVAEDFHVDTRALDYDCGEASIELTTSQSLGEPLGSQLENLSFSDCKVGGEKQCYVPYPSAIQYSTPAIERIGPDEGLASSFGASWKWACGNFGSGFEISFDSRGAEASYGAEEIVFEETPISEATPSGCGGPCIGEAWLTAHFEVVSPESIYLAQGTSAGTTLCKAAETYCAAGNIYPSETAISASAAKPVKIAMSYGNVECSSSTLEAMTFGTQGDPLEVGIEDMVMSGSCSDSLSSIHSCTAKTNEPNSTYGWLSWSSGSTGVWTLESLLEFRITCISGGASLYCDFLLEGDPETGVGSTFVGGNPAHVVIPAAHLGENGGWLCPSDGKSTLEADYTVNSPKPIYVSR